MQGLTNPNYKLRRAKEHLEALELEIRTFVESKPYGLTVYDDLEANEHVIELQFEGPPIWPCGAFVGDFVSCLRASLDHLVYGLVGVSGIAKPTINTAFPIIGVYAGQRTEDRFNNAVRGIPAEAISLVRHFQPYNAGNSYKFNFLWQLNSLWNIDKHRHIPLDAGACEIKFPAVPSNLPRPKAGILNDRNVMRFPMAAKPYVNFDPVSKVFVRFGIEKEGLLVTIEGLRDIYDFVSEKVIPRFTGFFSKKEEAG